MDWIDCNDRMPESNVSVMIYAKEWIDAVVFGHLKTLRGPKWIDDELDCEINYDVSHWMPLPETPSP